jgi:hypothetical protein
VKLCVLRDRAVELGELFAMKVFTTFDHLPMRSRFFFFSVAISIKPALQHSGDAVSNDGVAPQLFTASIFHRYRRARSTPVKHRRSIAEERGKRPCKSSLKISLRPSAKEFHHRATSASPLPTRDKYGDVRLPCKLPLARAKAQWWTFRCRCCFPRCDGHCATRRYHAEVANRFRHERGLEARHKFIAADGLPDREIAESNTSASPIVQPRSIVTKPHRAGRIAHLPPDRVGEGQHRNLQARQLLQQHACDRCQRQARKAASTFNAGARINHFNQAAARYCKYVRHWVTRKRAAGQNFGPQSMLFRCGARKVSMLIRRRQFLLVIFSTIILAGLRWFSHRILP